MPSITAFRKGAVVTIAVVAMLVLSQQQGMAKKRVWQFHYTAITAAPVKKAGIVMTGDVQWTCLGNRCFTMISRESAKAPSVGKCFNLANQIGVIIHYGHAKRKLNQQQLKRCNRRVSKAKPWRW